MTQFKYRPDIDGLRAISVLLVVSFHTGAPVSGGFVGVDVFFVISGFLITSLIQREIGNGSFSLVRFWERRVRRILPASIFCVLGTLALSALVMIPNDFVNLAKAAIANSLALANVYFWRHGDYFDVSSETKPLLHMWSLAVEEQFYLFYPFLLVVLARMRQIFLAPALLTLLLVSLLLSIWGVANNPSATFYLLPFRAWELLVGGTLAVLPAFALQRSAREVLAIVGFLLIIFSAFCFSSETPFPGLVAALPCFGAAFVIAANSDTNQETIIKKLLVLRPLVFIGVISYSFYLWHWPILALMRYILFEFNIVSGCLAFFTSFLIAVLSWKFVEQPFHKRRSNEGAIQKSRQKKSNPFLLGLVATTAVQAVSVAIILDRGVCGRFGETTLILAQDATWKGHDLAYLPNESNYPRIGADNTNRDDFMVLGDSHAMMMSDVINQASADAGMSGLFVAVPGIPPVPGVWQQGSDAPHPLDPRIIDFVLSSEIRNVILIARWTLYSEGFSEGDYIEDHTRKFDQFIIGDEKTEKYCTEDGRRVLGKHLLELVERLQQNGKQVWIVQQVPEQLGPTALPLFWQKRLGLFRKLYPTNMEVHMRRQAFSEELFSKAKVLGAKIIETHRLCFDENSNPILIRNGRACYRDNDHLTKFGAMALLYDQFETVMQSIASDEAAIKD